jgi:NAD-dependent dihydropyrimidine dehydrogenase PreA subunit
LNPPSTKKVAIIASLVVAIFSFSIYYRTYFWLGILFALGSGAITFLILLSEKIQRIRRALVVYYAIITWIGTLIIFSFIGVASLMKWVGGHLRVYYYGGMPAIGKALVPCNFNLPSVTLSESLWGQETAIESVVGISVIWPTSVFYFSLLVLFPFLLTAVVLGRGFCGWICYFGGTVDAFRRGGNPKWTLSKVRKNYTEPGKNTPLLDGLREDVKDVKYGVAIGLLLIAIGLVIPVICLICWTWIIQYIWWAIIAIVVFAITVIFLPFMTGKRTWCSILCPVAALINLIERITPFNVRVDPKKCTKDYSCTTVCPMYSMTRQTINEMYAPNVDCIKCGACIQQCPENAIDLYLLGTSKKVRSWFIPIAISAGMFWYIWFVISIVQILPLLIH